MKQVDRYILQQIIPPFLLSFFIALFVLMMQVLWVYIDNIIGKGVSLFEILEMVAYMSVSLVPRALPLAVLISMVMVFGGLSERYELASMKTAGVSLTRIMAFSLVFGALISVGSYYCSNNVIPITNLKFMTRLQDISNQKPALSLEEGIFNDDFSGYAIRINKKGDDGKSIEDVMIYDHRNARQGMVNILTAKKGEMYTTSDNKYLVMKLYNGHQFQELEEESGKRNDPIIRSDFNELTKLFDLSQFDLNKTDEDRYKSLETMLSAEQLIAGIDSLQQEWEDNLNRTSETLNPHLPKGKSNESENQVLKGSFTQTQPSLRPAVSDSITSSDSTGRFEEDTLVLGVYQLIPKEYKLRYLSKAEGLATGRYNSIRSAIFKLERIEKSLSRHQYELHTKFSIALMCFIFVLIGAPMGAIIRKGGYGYPLLVSIIFFMVYIILFIFTRQVAKSQTMDAILAAWLPDIVMFPIGLYLTSMANRDRKFSGLISVGMLFKGLFKRSKS